MTLSALYEQQAAKARDSAAEQLGAAKVSAYHYRVVFKPQTIMPDIDLRTSAGGAK